MRKVRKDFLHTLLQKTSDMSGYEFHEPKDLEAYGLSEQEMKDYISKYKLQLAYNIEKEIPDGLTLEMDDESFLILLVKHENQIDSYSTLIHELVHYLQNKNGINYEEDVYKYELEAYQVQKEYLNSKGQYISISFNVSAR